MSILERISEFESVLPKLWTVNTTNCPDAWSTNNPAANQCITSSLLAQDLFGGEIIRVQFRQSLANGQHFFNFIPEVGVRDFTRQQFAATATFIPPVNSRPEVLIAETKQFFSVSGVSDTPVRRLILSHRPTRLAYENLKSGYEKLIKPDPAQLIAPVTAAVPIRAYL